MQKLILTLILVLVLAAAAFAAPKRIISLAPSITEILFALGLEEKIVGVTANCDFPLRAKKIEKVGYFGIYNLEKIVKLEPDLVIAGHANTDAIFLGLKRMNIPLAVFSSEDLSEVLETVGKIGKITGSEELAKAVIAGMRARIARVKEKTRAQKKPRVFVLIWDDPLMTAGKDSFIHELVTIAGGENIAKEVWTDYSLISQEFVAYKNPEVIILEDMGRRWKNKNESEVIVRQIGLTNTSAAKTGKIYQDIDPDLLLRPGPRLIDGLEKLAKKLHK